MPSLFDSDFAIKPEEKPTESNPDKETFVDEVIEFIENIGNLPPNETILQLEHYIEEYRKFPLTKEDGETIANMEAMLQDFKRIAMQNAEMTRYVETKEIEQKSTLRHFAYKNSLWNKLFLQNSFNNELYGQAMFHVLLGAIAPIQIEKGASNKINSRVHLFFIQDSRSGKNSGINFLKDVLLKLRRIDGCELQITEGGDQTDQTLINRYAMKCIKGKMVVALDENGEKIQVPGRLTTSDLIVYPEANYLLNPRNHFQMETVKVHLNLLEPYGKVEKELVQWEGENAITFGGNYSFVALTRPIENVRKHVLYSGLLQRCLLIARELSHEDRRIMVEDQARHGQPTPEEKGVYIADFNELIKELQSLQAFAKNTKITIGDRKAITAMQYNISLWFMTDIEKSNLREDVKHVLRDFVANFDDHIRKLAYHSAIMRFSPLVEIEDYQYAFDFMKNNFETLKVWIEKNMETEFHDERMGEIKIKKFKEYLSNLGTWTIQKSVLIEQIGTLFNCSSRNAYREFQTFEALKLIKQDQNNPGIVLIAKR